MGRRRSRRRRRPRRQQKNRREKGEIVHVYACRVNERPKRTVCVWNASTTEGSRQGKGKNKTTTRKQRNTKTPAARHHVRVVFVWSPPAFSHLFLKKLIALGVEESLSFHGIGHDEGHHFTSSPPQPRCDIFSLQSHACRAFARGEAT